MNAETNNRNIKLEDGDASVTIKLSNQRRGSKRVVEVSDDL